MDTLKKLFFSIIILFLSISILNAGTMRQKILQYQLPEFCIYTQGWDDTDKKKYKAAIEKYGFGWSHMHHYCVGVEWIQKSYSFIGEQKKWESCFLYAIKEFDYILILQKKDKLTLKYMVFSMKAYALYQLNKIDESLENYRLATQFKKDYAPAYIGMADCYLKLGDNSNAAQAIKIGLKFNSKSELLIQKLTIIQQMK